MGFLDVYTEDVIKGMEKASEALRKEIIAEKNLEKMARREHWPLMWVKSVGPISVCPAEKSEERNRPG